MSTPESRPEDTPEPGDAATPRTEGRPEVMAAPGTEGTPEASLAAGVESSETDATAAMDALPEAAPDTVIATGPAGRGDDLRAAVGLPAQPERRSAPPRGPRRRIALFIGAIALLGVVVASLVLLGRQNRQRYYLVCGEDDITAAQGRSFPPWGRSALEGKAWQAIPRPLEAACTERVFDGREGLARSFGEMLVARTDAWVIARPDGKDRERLAEAQAQLEQAQRLLRELGGAGLPALSGQIQRLRGDLDYWQARDRIDTAMAELARAAQHLDSAVARDPQHNAEHAQVWQRVVARLQAELGAGPAGTTPPGAAGSAQPDAAAGNAPPAAPDAPAQPASDAPSVPLDGGLAPAPGSPSDAGPATTPPAPGAAGPGAPPDTPAAAPDAGPRRGGLLI